MSVEKVRNYLSQYHVEDRIQEFTVSSATVELAAQALNVAPARIAKTLSFKKDDGCILVVAAGDAKVDNRKFKDTFGLKAKMLPVDEVAAMVGHAVGGVCPFAVPENVPVYLDESMKRFASVFPAAGSSSSAVEMTCDELFAISHAQSWVDVCKLPEK
ncbi:YbaK/EbsC family protein [Anaerolentibacter hominis]|uniref:YbaK/EbsC family protein n=1 Tax=Anaerolentibacter hominis TaxID=3079009 RepID=UPI0031B8737A